MGSPSLAIGWQMVAANRRGLALSLAGVGALGLVFRVLPPTWLTGSVVRLSMVGLTMLFFYMMSVATFSNLKLGEAVSIQRYPSRMFVLPISSFTLVFWPMLYGVVGVSALWFLSVGWVYQPVGVELWYGLPGLMLAATVTFFQAVAWSPFGGPMVRVVAGSLLGLAPVSLVVWGSLAGWDDRVIAAILGAFITLSFFSGWLGVSMDRAGEGVDGRALVRGAENLLWRRIWRSHRLFASPAQAQLWFVWRRKGLPIPALVFLGVSILIFVQGLGVRGGESPDPPALLILLGFPFWMTMLLGPSLAKKRFWGTEYGLTDHMAARPMGTSELYIALLRTATRAMVVTWLLVAGLLVIGIPWSGFGELASEWWALLVGSGTAMAVVLRTGGIPLGAFAVALSLMLSNLTVGLLGRIELVVAVLVAKMILLMAMLAWAPEFFSYLLSHRDLLELLPWLLGGLLVGKLALTGLGFYLSHGQGLFHLELFAVLVVLWAVASASLIALSVRLLPALLPGSVKLSMGIACTLVIPLAQPLFGPLALARDRHRA